MPVLWRPNKISLYILQTRGGRWNAPLHKARNKNQYWLGLVYSGTSSGWQCTNPEWAVWKGWPCWTVSWQPVKVTEQPTHLYSAPILCKNRCIIKFCSKVMPPHIGTIVSCHFLSALLCHNVFLLPFCLPTANWMIMQHISVCWAPLFVQKKMRALDKQKWPSNSRCTTNKHYRMPYLRCYDLYRSRQNKNPIPGFLMYLLRFYALHQSAF